MNQTATKLDLAFTAPLRRDTDPGAWTIAVLPDSGRLLGSRKPVKVGGDIGLVTSAFATLIALLSLGVLLAPTVVAAAIALVVTRPGANAPAAADEPQPDQRRGVFR